MAATLATGDQFLSLLARSGIIEPAALEAYFRRESLPEQPQLLARKLVQDGLLTSFQAEQLLRGKWRGFDVGGYRVLERLGRGGMGSVFLADRPGQPGRVALKVLPPEQAQLPIVVERFHREARVAARLNHPNLVRGLDDGCDNGVHYLVMEYVDGLNLQDLVGQCGALAPERAANFIAQACQGLQFAHASGGFVHRDLKPANLLVDRSGVVKILDLGLARFFHDTTDGVTRKYNDRSILGTADYLAPEQALDSQSVDIRSDVYSLGCTLYFLLTGQPPFPGGTVTQKLLWHQLRAPRPIRELREDVPDDLVAVVERMMAKKPAERFQTPGEVVEALRKYLETPLAEEIPAPTTSKGKAEAHLHTPSPGPETGPASSPAMFSLESPATNDGLSGMFASPSKDIPALPAPRRWLAWAALAGGVALFLGVAVFLLL